MTVLLPFFFKKKGPSKALSAATKSIVWPVELMGRLRLPPWLSQCFTVTCRVGAAEGPAFCRCGSAEEIGVLAVQTVTVSLALLPVQVSPSHQEGLSGKPGAELGEERLQTTSLLVGKEQDCNCPVLVVS